MSWIYGISVLLILISTMLLKKTEEKRNLLKSISKLLVLFMCYQTAICYFLHLVNIPIQLRNLTIVNVIITFLICIQIGKKKEIQKYEIDKKDILPILSCVLVGVLVCVINFQGNHRLKYVSMDAREHYIAVREFAENETLTSKMENPSVSRQHMPMAYINIGIWFQVIAPYTSITGFTTCFILWELLFYILVGILFYYLVKREKHTGISLLGTILFLVGYPLNSWICGFHYLTLGLLVILMILVTWEEQRTKQGLTTIHLTIILFLLNLGMLFSYCLFAPVIYLAEGLWLLQNRKKEKSILLCMIGMVLPGVIGITYLLIPQYLQYHETRITTDGWIYKNLWSNFVCILPFTIYQIGKEIKEKKITFLTKVTIFLMIFMVIMQVARSMNLCSHYYFYKNYYLLWVVLWGVNIRGIFTCLEKKKAMAYFYFVLYVCFMLISVGLRPSYLVYEENAKEDFTTIMDIYSFNHTMLNSSTYYIKKEQILLIEEIEREIKSKNVPVEKVLYLQEPAQELWIQALTNAIDKGQAQEELGERITRWENDEYEYLVCFYESEVYQTLKEYIEKQDIQKLYENREGIIYKKEK